MKAVLLIVTLVGIALLLLRSGVLPSRFVPVEPEPAAPDTPSNASQSTSSPTPHPAISARAEAVRLYPQLAQKDSIFNRTFLSLYTQTKETNPSLLTNPDWPLQLAAQVQKRQQTEKAQQQKDQEIDQMMEGKGGVYMMVATIRQMTPDGALVDAVISDNAHTDLPWPGPVFIYDIPRVHADGETWEGKVYLVGNYQYTTALGATKTVKAFASNKALAKKLLLKGAKERNTNL